MKSRKFIIAICVISMTGVLLLTGTRASNQSAFSSIDSSSLYSPTLSWADAEIQDVFYIRNPRTAEEEYVLVEGSVRLSVNQKANPRDDIVIIEEYLSDNNYEKLAGSDSLQTSFYIAQHVNGDSLVEIQAYPGDDDSQVISVFLGQSTEL